MSILQSSYALPMEGGSLLQATIPFHDMHANKSVQEAVTMQSYHILKRAHETARNFRASLGCFFYDADTSFLQCKLQLLN